MPYIHERYFTELVGGVFRRETSQGMLAVVERIHTSHGIDAVDCRRNRAAAVVQSAPGAPGCRCSIRPRFMSRARSIEWWMKIG